MISQPKTDQTDRDISTVTDRIEIRDVYKIFGRRKEEALALVREGKGKSEILERTQAVVGVNNVSLSVPKGSISVIMGLSGSGKSTLARCVNRILEPDAGQILLDGEDYTKCSDARMREIRRRRISMVFQNFGLLPNQTVIDNVAFGLKLRKVPLAERHKKAGEMLETVGLSEWASHLPGELSGGMRQRVGLARALATEADVLIMDEAFSALDPLIRTEMQDELLRLQNTLHKTVLFITHDFQEALRLGTKIAVMADGAVIRDGTPQEIVIDPGHDYVAAFTRNVDRARLFDAASVMSEGPADAQGGRFVLNDAGEVAGWQAPNGEAMSDGYLAVRPETTLIEIAGAAARRRGPIAVVDAEGKFRGRITDEALLAGIAGAKETMKGSRTDA
ncbi:quaternary amine ABC transporter ATP-binding protein [Pseudooceanicola nanhaiensis]|uniref:quaternary amine ABC transporter ATP-binding protein n=1 Tax=Pseudooceanicola nanhaiensis TaxID=375761 RepID=UPI001CD1D553|nr:betaine/proline/choline family ABC transporter ATP-binding protein [Pseudooceanicola nanhaiensis]MCA0918759.1 betaine/proline/choline family ABC transporter ATP-binding protein [Pseudooceanicola nanhaiensis]